MGQKHPSWVIYTQGLSWGCLGLSLSEGLTEAGGSASKMTHSHGFWQEASVPCLRSLHRAASPRVNDLRERARQKPHVFYDLTSEVPYHHYYRILWITRTNSNTRWEETTQGCDYQEVRMLRSIWKLASTESITLVPVPSSHGSHTLPYSTPISKYPENSWSDSTLFFLLCITLAALEASIHTLGLQSWLRNWD